jgi:hypothetical protein
MDFLIDRGALRAWLFFVTPSLTGGFYTRRIINDILDFTK